MKRASTGELLPERGFTRRVNARLPHGQSAWVSHDGLVVVSSLEMSHLPGSGDPPQVGPQWLVSVSRHAGGAAGTDARCAATDDDVRRVVDCFAMPAFDEDNHHPGVARHLWCPVDPRYQQACECKLTETTIVEPSGYRWTTDEIVGCRGCEYERLFGARYPCTIHAAASVPGVGAAQTRTEDT